MRKRSHRHPALETAVFAAALLLAAFVGRELWRRRTVMAPPEVEAGPQTPAPLNPIRTTYFGPAPAPRTVTAVMVPSPIKLRRVKPAKARLSKHDTVPLPK